MHYALPLPDGSRYTVRSLDDLRWIYYNYYGQDDFLTKWMDHMAANSDLGRYFHQWQSEMDAVQTHPNPTDAQIEMGLQGLTPNATLEAGITNSNSQFNTQQAQDYNTWTMNNDLISQSNQLQQIGLTPSGVLQTGGSTGVGVAAAESSKSSGLSLKNQMKINKYNQQMSLAKSLIGAASSMASSGIYGAALGAVKHAGSQIAGAAAHSGLSALQATKSPGYMKYVDQGKFEVDKNGLLKL